VTEISRISVVMHVNVVARWRLFSLFETPVLRLHEFYKLKNLRGKVGMSG